MSPSPVATVPPTSRRWNTSYAHEEKIMVLPTVIAGAHALFGQRCLERGDERLVRGQRP